MPKATLPRPDVLVRTCRGIAALDAMLSEDWESRYYSFDSGWDPKGGVKVASMRNGCGDDWFIAFCPEGVFVKAFWHEHPRAKATEIYAGLPTALAKQRAEPAFESDVVTWGGWHDGTAWTLRGDGKPMTEELAILAGGAKAYQAYAAEYFEVKVPLAAITHVLAGKPLTQAIVAKVTTERTLKDLRDDLTGIEYGEP